jgi:hypothetical protein
MMTTDNRARLIGWAGAVAVARVDCASLGARGGCMHRLGSLANQGSRNAVAVARVDCHSENACGWQYHRTTASVLY